MSDEEHKHEKVVTAAPQPDGSVRITTQSFYDQLAHDQEEIEKTVPTSRKDVLKELVSCLELITVAGAPELVIRIKAKHGEPVSLTKRWVTRKESFNRR